MAASYPVAIDAESNSSVSVRNAPLDTAATKMHISIRASIGRNSLPSLTDAGNLLTKKFGGADGALHAACSKEANSK